ncbi:hypothetical protein TWF281_003175 [Arthrobotrys megalospora]
MSCKKVVSYLTAGFCVAPALFVSAVPNIELATEEYQGLIDANYETLNTLGEHFHRLATLIPHLDDFQPEVVDPLHLVVETLSDPNLNPAASVTGGFNEGTGEFNLPAINVYHQIDELIANILPRPIVLPSEIWTTHDGDMATRTFETTLKLLGTELTYGADNVEVPDDLFRWLFNAEIDVGTVVLQSDNFIALKDALTDMDTYIRNAVEAIDHAYYLSQWGVEHPSSTGGVPIAIFNLFKDDLGTAKGFWTEYWEVMGEIVDGMKKVESAVWPEGIHPFGFG